MKLRHYVHNNVHCNISIIFILGQFFKANQHAYISVKHYATLSILYYDIIAVLVSYTQVSLSLRALPI